MKMNLCGNCQEEVKETAKFCTHCGSPMDPELVKEKVTPASTTPVSNEGAVTIDTAEIQEYFFNYVAFFKDTLIKPSQAFFNVDWVNGLISVILFVILQTFMSSGGFFDNFVELVVVQAIYVGMLLLLNKFVLLGNDTYLSVLGKYGGLVNSQLLLVLAISLLGMGNILGNILMFLMVLNQLNIFNIYLFKSQTKKLKNLDSYYQVLLSYIAFGFMVSILFYVFIN